MKITYTIVMLFVSIALQAQEYMTLDRARELALSKNEDIMIANTIAEKAETDRKAARTNYFPSISAEATGMYMQNKIEQEMYLPTYTTDLSTGQLLPNVALNPATGEVITGANGIPVFNEYAYLPLEISLQGAYMAGIKLEQPLFTGGKILAGNKMADIGTGMAAENIQLKKMNAISEVDNSYWMYVSVQSKVKLAEKSVEMLKVLLERVENSYNAGLVNRNEVLKVQVEYDNAKLNLQKAKSGLELTRMSLCRVTGLDFSIPIISDSTILVSKEIISQFGSEDVVNRPEYKIMEKNIALEEQRIKTVRADYLPTVGVSTGYNYIGGVEMNNVEFTQGGVNVMASVKIPLFNWTEGKQKVASAKAQKTIKEYELEKNEGLLRLEIENAKLNLQDAALRIEITESALIQATENLKTSKDNYEVGRELMTDLLIAQTQWEKAYNAVIEAKTAGKLQETEYLRVTAKLLPE